MKAKKDELREVCEEMIENQIGRDALFSAYFEYLRKVEQIADLHRECMHCGRPIVYSPHDTVFVHRQGGYYCGENWPGEHAEERK